MDNGGSGGLNVVSEGFAPGEANRLWEAEGVVDRVVYANEETGYHVVELLCGDETITVVGAMPYIHEGERLCATGKFVTHRVYGKQLAVESAKRSLPDSREDILRYLMSGAVKGIGPVTAERIFDRFGDDALEVLENDPMQISEIKGISHGKAVEIASELTKLFDIRRMMLGLAEYGLRPSESLRTVQAFGDHTMQLVEENPYVLCSGAVGMDFERVDTIAYERGFEYNNRCRLGAGALHVLRYNLKNGHTCLPTDKLLGAAQTLLHCEPELAVEGLQSMLDSGEVVAEIFGDRQFCFQRELHTAEKYVHDRLLEMLKTHRPLAPIDDGEIAALEQKVGITYEEYQKAAMRTAVESGASLITGGPGTGKTTILYAVLRLLQSRGCKVSLAAPTGRAAKRMSQLVGWEAATIHRMLECSVSEGDSRFLTFKRNEENPLDADYIIIDEASMCDALVTEGLLRAVKPGAALLLVGDADQLPSVGPGNIMRDLCACGKIPLIRLTEIYRQAQKSRIVVNSHRINRGEMPDLTRADSDFFFLPASTEEDCARKVVDLCARRIPSHYKWSPFTEIQLLSPGRQGTLGTWELNKRLQAALNPPKGGPQAEFENFTYRPGDKIMQTHNNYDIMWKRGSEAGVGLFNGDCGIITEIDRQGGVITADFDGREVFLSFEMLTDIEPAYACTVHKSQGNEYEAVVIPIFPAYSEKLMYRNLLYTAVTRAKSLLVLVGNRSTLEKMVTNDRKSLRYTGLIRFFREDPPADAQP